MLWLFLKEDDFMRKRKTTLKKLANTAVEAVKDSKLTDAVDKAASEVLEKAPELAEKIMNAPVIEEGSEVLKETAEKISSVRTRITEVTFEIFETAVTMEAIQKAVKKDVSKRQLKGEIKIYINAEKRAAYYTVSGKGDPSFKIDLQTL